jgi:membrane protein implicated in regulation of membrane protease activity
LVIVGVVLLVVALVAAIAFTLRVGRRSQPDREREARAREAFDRTGEWPSE